MDIDKLIEQLNAWNEQHLSVVCGGKHFACDYLCENEDCIVVRAATALSTLQAENEKLRVEAEGMRSNWYKSVEEIKKLQAELEQVKRERDAAIEAANGLDKMIGRAWGGRLTMERITQEADFGLEDWEETLFFVKSDPNGAYNILDIAKYQGESEFDEILKNVALRLAAYEDTGLEPEEIIELKGGMEGLEK